MSKVEILGVEYTIERTDYVPTDDREMGFTVEDKALIVISSRMAPDVEKYILLHEELHAIDSMLHLGLTEQQIASLSVGLNSIRERR